MKRHRFSDALVGAVIIVTVAVTLFATLWVKQADIRNRQQGVLVRFRDVGGARLGNAVVIQGVRAGRIQRMDLGDDGWVEVRLSLAEGTTLPPDPVVMLNESSLFGEWQATVLSRSALPPDQEVQRQIAEAARGDSVLAGATLPDIAKLTTVAGQIAGDVAQVAERVEVAFDDRAARELRDAIRNTSLLSAQLAATVRVQSENLEHAGAEMRSGMTSVRTAAEAVARVSQRIDSTASPEDLRQIVRDMSAAAAQLRTATARIEALSGRLDRSQGGFDSLVAHTDSIMAKIDGGRGSLGLLVNDSRLYHNADSLVQQLRHLADDVKANPKKYVQVKIF